MILIHLKRRILIRMMVKERIKDLTILDGNEESGVVENGAVLNFHG